MLVSYRLTRGHIHEDTGGSGLAMVRLLRVYSRLPTFGSRRYLW